MLTIAICTHNRADDVATCLAALSPQLSGRDAQAWVVDSGSDEAHAALLETYAKQHGARYLRVDQPGLSLARNVAADQATGEWIAYLDDDAIPASNWLASLQDVLVGLDFDVGIIGGWISPRWPDDQSHNEVTDRWKLLLSCVERKGRGDVRDGFNICGANMVVRRSALNAAGGFPRSLGRIGNKLLSGEETYVIETLSQMGIRSIYDSAFAVQHRVSSDRLRLSWVRERAYWEGISSIRISLLLGKPIPRSQNVLKLAASVVLLTLMRLGKRTVDLEIRRAMALGALRARFTAPDKDYIEKISR